MVVYRRNYLSCQGKTDKVSLIMETKRRREGLPIIHEKSCSFKGYDAKELESVPETSILGVGCGAP